MKSGMVAHIALLHQYANAAGRLWRGANASGASIAIGDPGLTNSMLQLRAAQSATLQLSGYMPSSALWVESAGCRKRLKLKGRRELAHFASQDASEQQAPIHRSLRSLHTLQQPAHHRTPCALPYIGATCARRHGSRCMARSSSVAASRSGDKLHVIGGLGCNQRPSHAPERCSRYDAVACV